MSLQADTEIRARSGVGRKTARMDAGKESLQMVQELLEQSTGFRFAKSTCLRRGEGSLAERSCRVNLLAERLVRRS